MNILLAQETFLPLVGGAEIYVWKLALHLQELGHKVTILTAVPGPTEIDGIKILRFPLLGNQGKKGVLALVFYLPVLIRIVAKNHVVHGNYTALLAASLGYIARRMKRRSVITLHGFGTLDSSIDRSIWLHRWRKAAFSNADYAIAPTQEIATVAKRFMSSERIEVIPNGVDTQQFSGESNLDNDKIRIATVRRLVPKNGVQYLIESACSLIERTRKPIEFWIIGDGILRKPLYERVAALGLEKYFVFFGAIKNDEIRDILRQVDIVVFPSSAEATSIAALEAMAMAKPIVASSVGGYPEIIGNNERGLLVDLFDNNESTYDAPQALEPHRQDDLTNAILRLVNEPKLGEKLGASARDYVGQHHDWRVLALKVQELYVK